VGSKLPVGPPITGNIYGRFSTFFILENVGKIKKTFKKREKRDTNKKRKKTFLHLWFST